MALIVLTSATGSPGVTTTALALALTWPRPVLLVEADPTGGSAILAGYFRGQVPHPHGLVDLALAHRTGDLAAAIAATTIALPHGQAQLLAGSRSHHQAHTLAGLWEPLLPVLRSLEATGQDVLVDAGRLGLTGAPTALLHGADTALLVTRTSLPAVAAARSWAAELTGSNGSGTSNGVSLAGPAVGVLLVGEGRPYRAAEVSKALGAPVLASIPWDVAGAEVFSVGATTPRRFETSTFVRSIQVASTAIRAAAGERALRLNGVAR